MNPAHLELPLRPDVKELLARADKWWYCDDCGYVARDFPLEAEEWDPCPSCHGISTWRSVSALDRQARWNFVERELPKAAALASVPPDRKGSQ